MEAAIAALNQDDNENILKTIDFIWEQLISEFEYMPVTIRNDRSELTRKYLIKIVEENNQDSISKVIVGLGLIFRFYKTNMNLLYSLFDYLFEASERRDYVAASKLITNVAKDTRSINSEFAQRYLHKAFSWIEDPNDYQKTLLGLNVLQQYIEKLPSFFLLHYSMIADQLAPCIYCQDDLIRYTATTLCRYYLQEVSKNKAYPRRDIFESVYSIASKYITNVNPKYQHASILIFGAIISYHSSYFSIPLNKVYQELQPMLKSKYLPNKHATITSLLFFAKSDPSLFKSFVFKEIYETLMSLDKSDNCLCFTCDIFSAFIDYCPISITSNSQTRRLLDMIEMHPRRTNPIVIKKIIPLLIKILDFDPKYLENTSFVWKLIQLSPITADFIKLYKRIKIKIPKFDEDYSDQVIKKVMVELENPTEYALNAIKIISFLPIPENSRSFVASIVERFFLSRDPLLRAQTPRAMLHVIKDPDLLPNYILKIQLIGVSDSDPTVRAATLSSFDDCHLKYLGSDSSLEKIEIMANDSYSIVRKTAFRLLGKLARYSTIKATGILRNSVIQTLGSLQLASTINERIAISESLHSLVKAVTSITNTYTKSIMSAVYSVAAAVPLNDPIMDEYSSKLITAMFKVIDLVIKMDRPAVDPYIDRIVPVIIEFLSGRFENKLVVIRLLKRIVKTSPSLNPLEKFTSIIAPAVAEIVGETQSKVLCEKSLELLGMLGAMAPNMTKSSKDSNKQVFYDVFQMQTKELWQAHFGEIIFDKLLDMLQSPRYEKMESVLIENVINVMTCTATVNNESLETLVHHLLRVAKTSKKKLRKVVMMQLTEIIYISKQRIARLIKDIMEIVDMNWCNEYMAETLSVVLALILSVHSDFTDFVAPLFPKILELLPSSAMIKPEIALVCLPLLAHIGPMYANADTLILPQICSAISSELTPDIVIECCLKTLRYLVQNGDPTFHAQLIFSSTIQHIIHPRSSKSRSIAIEVVLSLMVKIGESYAIFAHRIVDILEGDAISLSYFEKVFSTLKIQPICELSQFKFICLDPPTVHTINPPKCKVFNSEAVLNSFNPPQHISPLHWYTWLHSAVLTWIEYSPCPAIAAIFDLCKNDMDLHNFIIFPAFFSCWSKLYQTDRQKLVLRLFSLMNQLSIPSQVLISLLRVVELMDRAKQPLFLEPNTLINLAKKANLNGFAYYLAQEQYIKSGNPEIAHAGATILYQTGQSTAIESVLNQIKIKNNKAAMIRLGRWKDALVDYKAAFEKDPQSEDSFTGYVKSARYMYQYQYIDEIVDQYYTFDKKTQENNALPFAEASFLKRDYWNMYAFSTMIPKDSIDGPIMTAFSCALLNRVQEGLDAVREGFQMIAENEQQQFRLSYRESYTTVLHCMELNEMKEALKSGGHPSSKMWSSRLAICMPKINMIMKSAMFRMAFTPDDKISLVKVMEIALNEKNFEAYRMILKQVDPEFDPNKANGPIGHTYMKYLWLIGQRQKAIKGIHRMIISENPTPEAILSFIDWSISTGRSEKKLNYLITILNEYIARHEQSSQIYQRWGSVNYHLYRIKPSATYAINCVSGFVNSIIGNDSPPFSDIAQLLWMFFKTADDLSVLNITSQSIRSVPPQSFRNAIPQLVGQLGSNCFAASAVAQYIVLEIARHNLSLVIFPLIGASQSMNDTLHTAAERILQVMTMSEPARVRGCYKLATVLVSASSTIFEFWADFSEDQLDVLLERTRTIACPIDRQFNVMFKKQLQAIEMKQKLGQSIVAEVKEIIHRSRQEVQNLTQIRLADISNEIEIGPIDIEIPGSNPPAKINTLRPTFDVMRSNQHPRHVTFEGSDGRDYSFLLKSNEDIELDQRVMQYFFLVNDLIDPAIEIRLRTYSVVPLSYQSGLIEWVGRSDTISSLLHENRSLTKIDDRFELNQMNLKTTGDVNQLRPIQRLEVLEEVAKASDDSDLKMMFWLRATTADEWLTRTLRFQRSSALNSAIGYILGLGDRHTSNIMIDKITGDVIHIDFGDCFEVARERVLFPELVPFRLTRNFIAAFGLGGIDADFRDVLETTLELIRENANPLISVLELFLLESNDSDQLEDRMVQRSWDKITGDDFDNHDKLEVRQQVNMLIAAATDPYNLAHLYSGWEPLV